MNKEEIERERERERERLREQPDDLIYAKSIIYKNVFICVQYL